MSMKSDIDKWANDGDIKPMKLLKRDATAIVGGLSKTSKMPGMSFGISAKRCITGSKLAKIEGSTCSRCYALSGMYQFKTTQSAHTRRLRAINNPQWIDAMITLISGQDYFRWFDSGDLQPGMIEKIVTVCNATPDTRHWLPTKEKLLLSRFLDSGGMIPDNLIIRLSAPMIDGRPPIAKQGVNTSTVHKEKPHHGNVCKAPFQNNECKKCRMCWDKGIANISYQYHGKNIDMAAIERDRKATFSVSVDSLINS